MEYGLFGKLFDMNRDGKLDRSEQYLDYMLFRDCCNRGKREDVEQKRSGFVLSFNEEDGKIKR